MISLPGTPSQIDTRIVQHWSRDGLPIAQSRAGVSSVVSRPAPCAQRHGDDLPAEANDRAVPAIESATRAPVRSTNTRPSTPGGSHDLVHPVPASRWQARMQDPSRKPCRRRPDYWAEVGLEWPFRSITMMDTVPCIRRRRSTIRGPLS
jgi:hypothetical protein